MGASGWAGSWLEFVDRGGPRVGAMLTVLASVVLAVLARRLVGALIERATRLLPDLGRPAGLREADLQRTRRAVGNVAFWLVLILGVVLAVEQLGVTLTGAWARGLSNYVPRIVAAIVIAAVGLTLARFGGAAASRAASRAGVGEPRRLGTLVEVGTGVVTALLAIDALGINVGFIQAALLIVVGGLTLGAALSFAGGSRELVGDILACHYVRRLYRVGQRVRIEDATGLRLEGRVLRILAPSVVLETAEGEVAVAASRFIRGQSTLLRDPS